MNRASVTPPHRLMRNRTVVPLDAFMPRLLIRFIFSSTSFSAFFCKSRTSVVTASVFSLMLLSESRIAFLGLRCFHERNLAPENSVAIIVKQRDLGEQLGNAGKVHLLSLLIPSLTALPPRPEEFFKGSITENDKFFLAALLSEEVIYQLARMIMMRKSFFTME